MVPLNTDGVGAEQWHRRQRAGRPATRRFQPSFGHYAQRKWWGFRWPTGVSINIACDCCPSRNKTVLQAMPILQQLNGDADSSGNTDRFRSLQRSKPDQLALIAVIKNVNQQAYRTAIELFDDKDAREAMRQCPLTNQAGSGAQFGVASRPSALPIRKQPMVLSRQSTWRPANARVGAARRAHPVRWSAAIAGSAMRRMRSIQQPAPASVLRFGNAFFPFQLGQFRTTTLAGSVCVVGDSIVHQPGWLWPNAISSFTGQPIAS